ncbi:MAG TPA: ATP-binding protein, partial [Holophagaceae bacterium]|nr:ATP-binding protein [Holophagaceae bacterium]
PQVAGVTYCLPVHGAKGALLGAVGVDLGLQKLDRLTSQYKPTTHARTFITSTDGVLLVPSAPDQIVGDPLRKAALAAPDADQGWPAVKADGRLWLVHRDHLDGQGWVLVAAIPMGDLVSVPRRITLIALVIGFLTILAITWRLVAVSRRITRPLLELAGASEGLLAEHPMAFPPTDIHELALAREALTAASASLQERQRLEGEIQRIQRLELLGNMAAGLAHDMNNHLSAIQGQIEIAGLKAPDGPSAPHIAQALEACGRMARLLQDLVAFGKPRRIVMEQVDLNALIQQTGQLLEHSRGKRMQVELDLDPSCPVVLGDKVQLEQVILNLGFNAKDATPEGGRISLLTRRQSREACFEISDTGTGMTAEIREKLFIPFYSTKGEGKGTGLGLAMVASIVKAHGGRITVESEPGLGSRFTVWLPLAEEQPS